MREALISSLTTSRRVINFLRGVLCGHRLDGFLDGGIDDAFLEENADFLVDRINLTGIDMVVQRDRGRNRLKVLGRGRGGGLRLLDLHIDLNHVLDKGRLESYSFVEDPVLYAAELAEYHPALAGADYGVRIVQHQHDNDSDDDFKIRLYCRREADPGHHSQTFLLLLLLNGILRTLVEVTFRH